MIPEVSSQGRAKISILWPNLSRSEAKRNSSRIGSTLCGKYPLRNSLPLCLQLSGSVQRHQLPEDGYLKPEMRSYFSLLMSRKVCPQLAVSSWWLTRCSNVIRETSPHRSCVHPVWQTGADEEVRTGRVSQHTLRGVRQAERGESQGSIRCLSTVCRADNGPSRWARCTNAALR